MSSESSSHADYSVPSFSCRIPAELIDNLPPLQKRFYEQMDLTDQRMAWFMEHAQSQAEKLEAVREQTTKTNGGLAQAKADIVALKEAIAQQQEQTVPVIRAYNLGRKLVGSKVFWAVTLLLVFIGLPALVTLAPAPSTVVSWALGILGLGA